MRVLVTGAGGFLGRAVVPALAARGHVVRALVRGRTMAVPDGVELVAAGELGPATDFAALLRDQQAVVHLAALVHRRDRPSPAVIDRYRAVNAELPAALARAAAAAGARRFVVLSSVFAAAAERAGAGLAQDWRRDPYAASKLAGERAVAAVAGLSTVILRPPLVYGPGAAGNLAVLLRAIRRGWPLPLGAVRNRRSVVGLGNLASAVAATLDRPEVQGVFGVSDGPPVSTPELIRALAAAAGRPARLWPVPVPLLAPLALVIGRHRLDSLTGDLVIEDAPFRTAFGWSPPLTMAEALAVPHPEHRALKPPG